MWPAFEWINFSLVYRHVIWNFSQAIISITGKSVQIILRSPPFQIQCEIQMQLSVAVNFMS
jgi:hypothetical protein